MSKQLALVIFVNVILALLFVFANIIYWNLANGYVNYFNPITLTVRVTPPGDMAGFIGVPNFPFELFWISMIINLIFIVWIQRNKEIVKSRNFD